MLEFSPADDEFSRVLRTRRTIGDFRSDCPPEELLLQAIEIARWAPNHKMTEPWRFHRLGPVTAGQIIELNTALITAEKGAEAARKKAERWAQVPGWVLVTCQTAADSVRNEENYAAVCCAIQNLMLFLWSRGVATKWATSAVLQEPAVAQLLQLEPSRERIVGLIWYGYPAVQTETRRRPVSEITITHP